MTTRKVSPLAALASATIIWLALAPAAGAQTRFGLRAGLYTRHSDPFVGVEALLPVQPHLQFNPNVEVAFASGGNLVTLNADFHYDLASPPGRYLWVGAGPALVIHDPQPDEPTTHTRAGLNLLVGGGVRTRGGFIPYIQGKVLLSSNTQGVLAVGVRF